MSVIEQILNNACRMRMRHSNLAHKLAPSGDYFVDYVYLCLISF